MRILLVAAIAALSACDSPVPRESGTIEAAVTYDGANATARAAVLAHGERMARMLGCKGCHGDDLQGKNVSADRPEEGDWWAPNVTLKMAEYGDAELDRLIRHGEPRDGRIFWFMPAETFQYVSDADYRALVAYLRTLPPTGSQVPPVRIGPAYQKWIDAGEVAPAPQMVARFKRETPADLGEPHRLGRYIAMTVCTECHNSRLQGYTDFTPDIVAMAGAYNAAELRHLLTTGEGKAKKDLGLMSVTARNRFARLTEREMDALVAYLKALPAAAQ